VAHWDTSQVFTRFIEFFISHNVQHANRFIIVPM